MFEYDEMYNVMTMELNGIVFCCDEEQDYDYYVAEAEKLSSIYYEKLPEIAKFMLADRLQDFYGDVIGELTPDKVKENLGVPMIDLENDEIIYCDHTLDYDHIFTVDYLGDIDELLSCSVNG